MAKLPLSHIKVLDLTAHRAGPTAVGQLADWGAQVIKIEQPSDAKTDQMGGSRHGFDFQNLHRNKKAMTLNLKSPEGHAIFMKLAAKADVIVENYRSDVKHRLKVDYDTVAKINPRIVYGSIAGFGQSGPDAARPGVDQIAKALGAPELIDHPEHLTGPLRSQNRKAVNERIAAITKTKPSAYWLDAMNKAGVPCGPINTIDQTFAEPQVKHLGIARAVKHPKLGDIKVVGQPINLSDAPQPKELRPTPELGEHTEEVLASLGYDRKAIDALKAGG